jgi:hypothetical protein
MANIQIDPESAVNDLLDQIAFIQREKAAIQMQLAAAYKRIDELQTDQSTEEEATDGSNTV